MKGGRHFSSAKAMPSTSSTSRTVVDRPQSGFAWPGLTQFSCQRRGAALSARAPQECGRRLGLHTQWPGAGVAGDPIFDNFYAAQVGGPAPPLQTEEGMKAAGAALLDKIGPAIVIGHSRSQAIFYGYLPTRDLSLWWGWSDWSPEAHRSYDVTLTSVHRSGSDTRPAQTSLGVLLGSHSPMIRR